MPMRLLVQGQEGADHVAFLGADTTFKIQLMDRDGAPVSITAPKFAIIQVYADTVRSSAKLREYIVTPDGALSAAGLGTFDILDSEAQITTRDTYYMWALFDDASGVDWGKIQSTIITDTGEGYSANPTIVVDNTDTGGGTLFAATATIKGGVQTTVAITAGGSGYTTAPSVTFNTPPGGVAAIGTAAVSGGAVISVTISSPGSGYSVANPPVITFGGPGTLAAATAKINGSLDVITIGTPGSGYKRPPVLTVTPGVGDTTGKDGTLVGVVTRGAVQISETASSLTIK